MGRNLCVKKSKADRSWQNDKDGLNSWRVILVLFSSVFSGGSSRSQVGRVAEHGDQCPGYPKVCLNSHPEIMICFHWRTTFNVFVLCWKNSTAPKNGFLCPGLPSSASPSAPSRRGRGGRSTRCSLGETSTFSISNTGEQLIDHSADRNAKATK